jgi:mannose-6-phosphate isomerase-like protein (cupin superfamily)
MDKPPTFETPTSRLWHLRTGTDSSGEVHEQRVEYLLGSPFPPSHFHPAQDEYFEVESGAMVFVIGGAERVVSAGESIEVPRRVPHKAKNASDVESAVVRWETRPALRTTEFFATAAQLGRPGPLDAALLAQEYRDVFRLAGFLRFVVPPIARVAVLTGRQLPVVGGSHDE